MDPYRFSHRLRVRWAECDKQGIVFNPHYMMYVDVALTEYWRALGIPYPQALLADGLDNFMVTATLNYRDAACYDDEIDIFVRTEYFGTTSFRIGFSIRRGDGVLVEGTAAYVTGDAETRRPRPLPVALVERVEHFEHVAPEKKAVLF